MRTKTNEKKRYSLRTQRSIIYNEEDIMNVNENPIKKPKPSSKENTIPSKVQSRKAKRKSTKPTKSVSKDDEESISTTVDSSKQIQVHATANISPNEKQSTSMATQFPDSPVYEKTAINKQQVVSTTPPVKIPPEVSAEKVATTSTRSSNEADFPVYTALEHAVHCRIEKGCMFQKCAIAKQFLLHSSSCTLKIDDCTICKAMDIMVCKHAEKCEAPLDKSCPIPKCNHVRQMIMEEWLKFKNNHHEIVTRAFSGLLHARKCKDKSCQSILCANIKSVLQHTQTCKKQDECKTRRFVVQLCEYHQETCTDDKCRVEFCDENRRAREEEKLRKQKEEDLLREKQEYMYKNSSSKPMSNFGVNNMIFPNPFSGLLNIPHLVGASGQDGSGNTAMPNVPPMVLPFPYVNWPNADSNYQPNQEAASKSKTEGTKEENAATASANMDMNSVLFSGPWNGVANGAVSTDQQGFVYPGWPYTFYNSAQENAANNSMTSEQIPTQEKEVKENESIHEQSVDSWLEKNGENAISPANEEMETESSSLPSSQTELLAEANPNATALENAQGMQTEENEMYYQLWPLKGGEQIEQKSQLPRLSPSELQAILARGENSQILSPVHDNRAQFSEAPFLLNDFQQHSQESELEENSVEGVNTMMNQPGNSPSMTNNNTRTEKVNELMKKQEEWSKIDFIKEQNTENGYDVDTETADETENDSVYDQTRCDEPDPCYFLKKTDNVTVDVDGVEEERSTELNMTPLERNFLTILKSSINAQSRNSFS